MSLRTRLTLWLLVAAVALSGGAVGAVYVLQSRQLEQRLDTELRLQLDQYADWVASAAGLEQLRTSTEAYLRAGESQALRLGGLILLLATEDGALVSNSSDVKLEEVNLEEGRSSGQGFTKSVLTPAGWYRVMESPVRLASREVGEVRIAAPLGPSLAARDQVVLLVAILLTIGTIGVGAGVWLILGRALGPVRRITQTAASISREDLQKRIEYAGPRDEIGELAQTMDAMLERLEDAFAGQERFISDVSHELRTPLTIAKGHLQVLDRMEALDLETCRSEHLVVIEELDRMNRLVGELLMLAKAGRVDFLRREDVVLDALLAGLAGQAPHLAADRDWQVESFPGGVIRADQDRLTQAFLNLMQNAVAHTDSGDLIALGAARGVHTVQLWVRDTGRGMKPEMADHVFERFYRGEAGRDTGSRFGLGLAIVSAIAKAHGGVARVETQEGVGSRFVLELPSG
ncbi:MAG: HAMP domain-containing histidine kinase [Anaerolineales bacterium]|nr:HAMP domain-containing histidine kinase [Anaerolineales bacterium]